MFQHSICLWILFAVCSLQSQSLDPDFWKQFDTLYHKQSKPQSALTLLEEYSHALSQTQGYTDEKARVHLLETELNYSLEDSREHTTAGKLYQSITRWRTIEDKELRSLLALHLREELIQSEGLHDTRVYGDTSFEWNAQMRTLYMEEVTKALGHADLLSKYQSTAFYHIFKEEEAYSFYWTGAEAYLLKWLEQELQLLQDSDIEEVLSVLFSTNDEKKLFAHPEFHTLSRLFTLGKTYGGKKSVVEDKMYWTLWSDLLRQAENINWNAQEIQTTYETLLRDRKREPWLEVEYFSFLLSQSYSDHSPTSAEGSYALLVEQNEVKEQILTQINEAIKSASNAHEKWEKWHLHRLQSMKESLLEKILAVRHNGKVVLQNQPFTLDLSVQNWNTVEVSIFPLVASTKALVEKQVCSRGNYSDPIHWRPLFADSALRTYTYNLERGLPRVTVSERIEIQGLPAGIYLLEFGEPKESKENILVSVGTAHLMEEGEEKYVLDASGKPQEGIGYTAWDIRNRAVNKGVHGTTDHLGRLDLERQNFSGFIELSDKGKVWLSTSQYFQFGRPKPVANNKALILTDRVLYKPGDTVECKLTGFSQKEGLYESVLPNKQWILSVDDPSGEEVWKSTVRASSYGSAYAQIPLSVAAKKGRYTVYADKKYVSSFQIEEYEKPGFQIEIKGEEEPVALGDTLRVHLSAQSYSGIPLNQANASLKVLYSGIPWREYQWGCGFVEEQKSLPTKKGTLDAFGRWTIDIPTQDIERSSHKASVLSLELVAEIQDINGEIQTETREIMLSNKGTWLEPSIQNTENASVVTANLKVSNSWGVDMPSQWDLYLVPLIPPKDYISEPKSKEPFLPIAPVDEKLKGTYDTYFTADPEYWKKGKERYLGEYSQSDAATIELLESGYYELQWKGKGTYTKQEASKIFHRDLGEKAYMPVMAGIPTLQKSDWKHLGDTLAVSWRIHPSSRYVVQLWKGREKVLQESVVGKSMYTLSHCPTPEEHGNYTARVFSTDSSGILLAQSSWEVLPLMYQLNVSVEMSSLISPKEETKGAVMVKDAHGNLVDAEVFVTIYDAKLDAIVPYSLHHLKVHPYYGGDMQRLVTSTFSPESYFYVQKRTQISIPNLLWDIRWRQDILPSIYSEFGVLYESEMYGDNAMTPRVVSGMNQNRSVEQKFRLKENPEANEEDMELEKTSEDNISTLPRKNFKETIACFPHLPAKNGNAEFEFTMSDDIGRYKTMVWAHTKTGQTGVQLLEFISKKDLEITPFVPEQMYLGDETKATWKISNHSAQEVSLEWRLEDEENVLETQAIRIAPQQSIVVKAELKAQELKDIVLRAGVYKDGEALDLMSHTIPVIPNTLTTLYTSIGDLAPGAQDSLVFPPSHDRSTQVSIITHPLYEALGSFPLLRNSNPKLATRVFSEWWMLRALQSMKEQEGMSSALEAYAKNAGKEALDQIRLTPLSASFWAEDMRSFQEDRKELALLLSQNLEEALQDNTEQWKSFTLDAGFTWYSGSQYEQRTITAWIYHLLARVKSLGSEFSLIEKRSAEHAEIALVKQLKERWEKIKSDPKSRYWSTRDMQCFIDMHAMHDELDQPLATVEELYFNKIRKSWNTMDVSSLMLFAQWASILGAPEAQIAIESLAEKAQRNDEGMYWNQLADYLDHGQLKLAVHAQYMLFLLENGYDKEALEMRKYLLFQKRGKLWDSSIATGEVIFSLLRMRSILQEKAPKEAVVSINDSVRVFPVGTHVTFPSGTHLKIENKSTHPIWYSTFTSQTETMKDVAKTEKKEIRIEKTYAVASEHEGETIWVPLSPSASLPVGEVVQVSVSLYCDRPLSMVEIQDYFPMGCSFYSALSDRYFNNFGSYYLEKNKGYAGLYFTDIARGNHTVTYLLKVQKEGVFTEPPSRVQSAFAPEFTAWGNGAIREIE